MRIAIGCDDVGLPLKESLIPALEAAGHSVLDLGAFSAEPADYPDCARLVGQAVARGFVETGVVVCGSAVGASIAANKLRGVRAAPCADVATARESREQQDANILCLPARALDTAAAIEVATAWIGAPFSGGELHARRLAKIAQLEQGLPDPETAPAQAAEPGALAQPGAAGGAPAATPAADALTLPAVETALAGLESADFLNRLWVEDTTLWKGEADAIRSRLGWLSLPTLMREHSEQLKGFADEIRRLQFSQVVVLGMGGSSLASDVMRLTWGSRMGFPDLVTLDSTDPEAVRQTLNRINHRRTLFVVATKSGTTTETLSLYSFFRHRVEAAGPPKPGLHFVAITDPGGPLDKLAADTGFRRTFLSPTEAGGRYSALSYAGLVPAALIGVDIETLLERAHAMLDRCCNGVGERESPGVELGAALAGLAQAGRDKVTLVLSKKIRALGSWIEQLLAESLGKDGRGVVPVVDEPLGEPAVYGADRVFVALILEGDRSFDAALEALADAGHPVIRLTLADPLDVGGEFFRWELAAAAAGAVLGVNPFDEPDMTRAKEKTTALLTDWKRTRRLPEWPAGAKENGIVLAAHSAAKPKSVVDGLASHLAQATPGDYLAIQAYLTPLEETWSRLQEIRVLLRDRLRLATTVAFGPRYLHSTGQLHKGGPPNGLFVQITGEDKDDLAIPGAGYGFATLKAAQALGDLLELRAAGRRVIRLQLVGKPGQALGELTELVHAASRKL